MSEHTDVSDSGSDLVLLRDGDVQKILGCSVDQLRRFTARGDLKFIKVGRSRRYKSEWVSEFIDAESTRRERIKWGAMEPSRRSAERHGMQVAS